MTTVTAATALRPTPPTQLLLTLRTTTMPLLPMKVTLFPPMKLLLLRLTKLTLLRLMKLPLPLLTRPLSTTTLTAAIRLTLLLLTLRPTTLPLTLTRRAREVRVAKEARRADDPTEDTMVAILLAIPPATRCPLTTTLRLPTITIPTALTMPLPTLLATWHRSNTTMPLHTLRPTLRTRLTLLLTILLTTRLPIPVEAKEEREARKDEEDTATN